PDRSLRAERSADCQPHPAPADLLGREAREGHARAVDKGTGRGRSANPDRPGQRHGRQGHPHLCLRAEGRRGPDCSGSAPRDPPEGIRPAPPTVLLTTALAGATRSVAKSLPLWNMSFRPLSALPTPEFPHAPAANLTPLSPLFLLVLRVQSLPVRPGRGTCVSESRPNLNARAERACQPTSCTTSAARALLSSFDAGSPVRSGPTRPFTPPPTRTAPSATPCPLSPITSRPASRPACCSSSSAARGPAWDWRRARRWSVSVGSCCVACRLSRCCPSFSRYAAFGPTTSTRAGL